LALQNIGMMLSAINRDFSTSSDRLIPEDPQCLRQESLTTPGVAELKSEVAKATGIASAP
jgi:hypothetical protein